MQTIRSDSPGFEAIIAPLMHRSAFDPEIDRGVAAILAAVKARGDAALVEYARQFDDVELRPDQFQVSEAEIMAAFNAASPSLKKTLKVARKNILEFSRKKRPSNWSYTARRGVRLGEQ
ncbi:MAG: histidinol dehydrogenase, partial [Victivallales bacterium]|nr:histidinol dehydrogenase [Victivallales bacterium]